MFLFILILATIVLFKMNQTMYGQYGIGAVVLTIVVMVLTRRPSDAYIDGVVAEEMKKLEAAALKKLGLDKEEVSVAEPIMTYGYLTKVNQISIADETLGKTKIVTGKDKLERSPVSKMCFAMKSPSFIGR